jgi:hypothetical protein
LISVSVSNDDVFHMAVATAQHLVHRRASIGAEMELIRHQDRFGRALPSAFGIRAGPIADDDLDTGVVAQPIGKDLGSAIVEQVNRPVRLQIEQQRAIATLLRSQREVIDTQNSRTALFTLVGQGVQQAKQRIRADGYANFARQTRATLATGLQRERGQQISRFVRPSSVVGEYAIETLGEDLTRAIWHIAEPPPAVNTQAHGVAAPGQVKRSPKIAAVLTSAQFAAFRARNGLACGFGDQHQAPIELNDDQDDLPVLRSPATRLGHRLPPR